ncbi:MAG TPA: NADH-quinone oxidoreductase subunit N [Candidatus Aminicenantes bacterium]|nr:NADH-quinone oxidoreductase subunit N [Candidatus Aminicenantes bacterium]HRY65236.1 NADH-quinone oxidoreductase subunit N [Candidatus Aminicenantes bacterium]HRZ72296.1 NADH-quinone oxidoreductase subunit N [Candidatus Aminicenantes bacterium]
MSFLALAPILAVVAGALISLLLEAFLGRKGHELSATAAVVSLLAAGYFIVRSWNLELGYFAARLSLDPLALLLMAVFVVLGAFVILMSLAYASRRDIALGQLCGLLLIALAGLMIMVSSTDWLVVFLGLEVLSVASYALTGLRRSDPASSEAAAKYFLMGSFAGAFFVFGLAILFGTSGSMSLASGLSGGGVPSALPAGPAVGLGLIVAALFFKIAVAPFHMWAPDVYEGAPTPVAAFLTIAPKAAGLVVLLRVLAPVLGRGGTAAAVFGPVVSAAAVLTMFAGNLAALRQSSVKRLLAYSAIAHSGYLLVAVAAGDGPGLVFYLIAYLFMNAGAFAVLTALEGDDGGTATLDGLAGLGRRHPALAACLAVFLLSLAGFPPTAGFLAKFYVFSGAVAKGHVVLVVAAVLASLVSVAYYLKVIMVMYMKDAAADLTIGRDEPALWLVVFLCVFGVVQLGLWPGNLLTLIRQGSSGLF